MLCAQADNDYQRPLQVLAVSLAFVDPVTGKDLRFASELQLQGLE